MIRPAVPQDAEAIDRVRVRAWEHAFGDLVPSEPEPAAAAAERTWVWDQDGFVAGFASERDGRLRALYVEPAAQGAGVGSALLAHVETAMRAEGHRAVILRISGANGHGRRFFEARGWELLQGGEDADGDVGYRKPL